jgi:osmoprotectant transport system ATP-binding protein
MTTAPLIELINVSKSFDGERSHALFDVSLRIDSGGFVAVVGTSGSGKTTALKMINRLLEPDRGEVRFDGEAVERFDAPTLRRRIGYVFQGVGLFPHMTVGENIAITPHLLRWSRSDIEARVAELLDLVELPRSFAARFPHALSGGQRQRAGVARAIAARPRVMLMDEPFGALDPLTRAEVQKEFLGLQQRLQKTVVFVTHDLPEALRLGTRIALMEAGKLVTLLTPAEFLTSSDRWASAYVRAFGDGLESAADRGKS